MFPPVSRLHSGFQKCSCTLNVPTVVQVVGRARDIRYCIKHTCIVNTTKPLTPKKPKKSKEKQPFLENVRNKKTDCPSSLILTVTVPSSKTKTKSCTKISHPTIIKMCFNHDHLVDSAHALSFRPIASQIKESYYRLFSFGHSAATAQHTYETKMMLEADEEEMVTLGDRALNPNPQDVSRLHNE